jgi:hypothetical protein
MDGGNLGKNGGEEWGLSPVCVPRRGGHRAQPGGARHPDGERGRAARVRGRFVDSAWFALVAPPGTPDAIAQRINAAVVEALKTPEVHKRFLDQGLTPVGNSPAEMAAFVAGETARWQKVIRTANIRLE